MQPFQQKTSLQDSLDFAHIFSLSKTLSDRLNNLLDARVRPKRQECSTQMQMLLERYRPESSRRYEVIFSMFTPDFIPVACSIILLFFQYFFWLGVTL